MMEEIWKDIVGYEGLYRVSNKGNVYSYNKRSRKNLKLNIGTTGYYRVNLAKQGVTKQFRVHRIVAQHFLEYDEDKVVNHIDGNKLNNNIENLELVTQKENIYHSWNKLNKNKIKKVLKLDKTTLKVIEEYENVKIASIKNNVSEHNIYKCLNYRGFSAGGYRWIYKKELNDENLEKMKKINGEKGKPWLRFKKGE